MPLRQPDLFEIAHDDPNIECIVGVLRDGEWITAGEILKRIERPDTLSNRRWLRAIAHASAGQIAGGQQGYKLVEQMTKSEYDHWRNWMKSQADEMTRRIIESDKVFYRRNPVTTGNGILWNEPGEHSPRP